MRGSAKCFRSAQHGQRHTERGVKNPSSASFAFIIIEYRVRRDTRFWLGLLLARLDLFVGMCALGKSLSPFASPRHTELAQLEVCKIIAVAAQKSAFSGGKESRNGWRPHTAHALLLMRLSIRQMMASREQNQY